MNKNNQNFVFRSINYLSDFSNWKTILRSSYIYVILLAVYIPLFFGLVFSFNQETPKGEFNTTWTKGTFENWRNLFDFGRDASAVNSFLLAFIVGFINVFLSLITVYALYRQKNKLAKPAVLSNSNIPLVNPDNITAIGLVLVFGLFFGITATDSEGFFRVIVGHVVMVIPYGISLSLPRSYKFNNNLFEASQDLGYSKLRSWFKTYFVYMLPSILMTFVVSFVFSIDDFIIARTVSNTSTLGTKLYEGAFQAWGLILGSIVLIITLVGNVIYTIINARKKK
ncbi:ABC transporter permease [Mycoplasmopsis synoviae]|uniref:Spermidine/putrescine transport system permease PotC n=1 Tax=Mycoplasmopsis synoviae (strain 53) TaxID=262723 RepID=Q4A5Q2_MYCS5|nr:ABC transporter permease subunit [Mycoplasmopsis synoviae]AAZ43919.2 spermidine/putrescine transport system permease PotC [Mycoplasmopsis synoviae 53]